MFITVRFLTH